MKKYLTAEQIHSTKKVGDKIIFKNNLINAEIIEIGTIYNCAESFFSASNIYQDIKFIHFLYGDGQKSSIYSHMGVAGYTILNNIVYKESNDWVEYYFMDGEVYEKNQINEYKKYLETSFNSGDIDIYKYNELLLSIDPC